MQRLLLLTHPACIRTAETDSMPKYGLILAVLVGGPGALLGYQAVAPVPTSASGAIVEQSSLDCSPAIAAFSLVNAQGREIDPTGGPPVDLVGHHLELHLVVAPAIGSVRITTSAGPLTPPEDMVSVEASPTAQGQVDLALDVPGRPDRVVADASPRAGSEQTCALSGGGGTFERLIRLDIKDTIATPAAPYLPTVPPDQPLVPAQPNVGERVQVAVYPGSPPTSGNCSDLLTEMVPAAAASAVPPVLLPCTVED
ncbi:MAG: hypothetical protein ACRD1G_15560, partial [Acidimicrobiales bacterium]